VFESGYSPAVFVYVSQLWRGDVAGYAASSVLAAVM
jgi:hypothetical protein